MVDELQIRRLELINHRFKDDVNSYSARLHLINARVQSSKDDAHLSNVNAQKQNVDLQKPL